ncbi:MAG: alternative ribosome rescue aminoacyl-tRNA hydrolase ArfB [Marinirhabdus sp.]|nr:alternative ribosome rescue aminoacyl-tRNA hydrolase ArfB [Marinirhabdus sp.]
MDTSIVLNELNFKAVRSSGAGGQHVNKTASKVELHFNVEHSEGLSEMEKERLLKNLKHRLTKDSVLILACSDTRSQHRNKTLVIKRFLNLIEAGVKVRKKRKKSKPSKSAIEKRLREKKKQALKKKDRKPPSV